MKLHPIQQARNNIKAKLETSPISEADKDFIYAELAKMMVEHATLYSKMDAAKRILTSKTCCEEVK